ncbi:MAG: CDP-alcohol phosphatidyltransferase family protein [Fusobacteriaceae bacterium]
MLDTHSRKFIQPIIEKIGDFFIEHKYSANEVTTIALIVGCSSGILAYLGLNILAVIVLWISGILDVVDGTIARKKGSTPFGTVMDITFDRIVEISVILGLALSHKDSMVWMLLLTCSIIISMTVFLTTGIMSNKKSEKSFYYQSGVVERTEAFILLSLMLIFINYLNILAIVFFLGVTFTAGQRFFEAKKNLN